MRARVGLDFDRDVAEAGDVGEARLVGGRRFRPVANQRDDGGMVAGKPYCEHHVEVAYIKPKDKSEAA